MGRVVSILGWGLGLLGGGGIVGLGAGLIFAPAIFAPILKGIVEAAVSVFQFALKHWKVTACLIAGALLALYVLNLRGDLRHDEKVIAGQVAWGGLVMREVNRGVCGEPAKPKCAVPPEHAPDQIRSFVDNEAATAAALAKQSAQLVTAKQDAEDARAAAHDAGQPTAAQGARLIERQHLADPKRTTGTTADEWRNY
jgi:hypothetical protein